MADTGPYYTIAVSSDDGSFEAGCSGVFTTTGTPLILHESLALDFLCASYQCARSAVVKVSCISLFLCPLRHHLRNREQTSTFHSDEMRGRGGPHMNAFGRKVPLLERQTTPHDHTSYDGLLLLSRANSVATVAQNCVNTRCRSNK